MGFRFSRRIKIMPGVRINLSKSGASLSAGPRGASVTVGKNGVYGNVGIPGTGLSYRDRLNKPSASPTRQIAARSVLPDRFIAILDGDAIRFTDGGDCPIDEGLVPAARRAMKAEITALLEREVAIRNNAIDELTSLHHDVPSFVQPPRLTSPKPLREAYSSQHEYMEALMIWRAAQANTVPDAMVVENEILLALGNLEFPHETNIAIELRGKRLLLDVDLPELEDMPCTQWATNLRDACVVAKQIPPKVMAGFYVAHVSSIIVRLIGHSFAVSSFVGSVAASAYTQRSGSTGRITDDYVATVEIDRNGWNQVDCTNIKNVDPENLLRKFDAKMDVNVRGVLKVQRPLA